MVRLAPRNERGLALTRAQAFLDPEVLSRDLDRALDHPNQVGVHALQPITTKKAIGRYPIRKVTTPVPVEGGVAGGALPISAGTQRLPWLPRQRCRPKVTPSGPAISRLSNATPRSSHSSALQPCAS